ncbi:MAG: hypothetical protein IPF66_00395 [Holophagales bacterium]|nr:hypothetical protein [Holophagales bacterium]
MPEGGFLALVHNASLLLALALVYDLATARWRAGASRLRQVPVGLAVGGIGVAVMLSSWTLEPGIVFDTRSILLGVAGLYFGTVPTVIAMAVTSAFRIWMGARQLSRAFWSSWRPAVSVSSGGTADGRVSPTWSGSSSPRSVSPSTWRCSACSSLFPGRAPFGCSLTSPSRSS